ncbi:CNNM domain-containing protein [Endozoicomonas sp. SCSIO W0465]|uniref:CNNM domain-containing protein n=1 Tax=Endozoicomonas sp. SCSIO W0465 TaxID=2918516 RepID=UPI00207632E1|nr:CNNM domain-containing protein [Endozoicomonas sp. SCSIO W0465]USE35371.1 CNNM domain-containing protein [Endozoicomonas sp. SCSIO W0465]
MLLVVLFACLIVAATAFLSLLEASLVAVDELRLVTILYRRPDNKAAIQKVFQKKREHLSAIVLLSTLISISGSTFLGAMAAKEFNDLWMAIFTALLAYFMLVFAKVLPKLLAVQIADRVVARCSPFIQLMYRVTKPVLLLALVWTRLLPKLEEEARSSDELRSIIKHYNKRGVIGKRQRKLADAILTTHQRQLTELVEHSMPAVCLSSDTTVASVETTIRTYPCKRYVVLTDGRPAGIVLYRHIARCLVNGKHDISVGTLMRKTINLAPATTLHKAMTELHKARASIILLPGETVEQTRIVTAKKLYQALLRADNQGGQAGGDSNLQ